MIKESGDGMAKKEKKEKKGKKAKKEKRPREPRFLYDKAMSALGGMVCFYLAVLVIGIVLTFVFRLLL